MKKWTVFIIFIILSYQQLEAQNQYKDWGIKFGIRYNLLFPENEFANLGLKGSDNLTFEWYRYSYLIEGFAGFELSKVVELQAALGYGIYSGRGYSKKVEQDAGDYESSLTPITLRLKINPFNRNKWNPYIYIGTGTAKYTLNKIPQISSRRQADTSGWFVIFPIGVGAEVKLSKKLLLDISLGGAMTSTLDLDGYRGEANSLYDSYFNLSFGLSWIGESCKSDRDNDGLTKCEEQALGTDPEKADTDGDGLKDGEEVNIYKTNPLSVDTDGDGLSDYDEVKKYNTDPNKADTDGDGLNDYDEIMIYKSNPNVADTDGDGISDGDEVLKYKSDPLKVDTDDDGLTDYDEIFKYKTDPLNADTDGDGLSDKDEIINYRTDPLKADTDEDGLNDFQEVVIYGTDPLLKDTDGGSVDDGTEVNRGTDPFNPYDDVEEVKVGVPIVLEGIYFAKGKATITAGSEETLNLALKTLQEHKDIVVEISGHTDNVGGKKYNKDLSQRRANAVKEWLVNKGIESNRIFAVGYGQDRPIAPNNSEENKQKNRRIEFVRIK